MQKRQVKRTLLGSTRRSRSGNGRARCFRRILSFVLALVTDRVEEQCADHKQHHDHDKNTDREGGILPRRGLFAAVIGHEIEALSGIGRSARSYPTWISEGLRRSSVHPAERVPPHAQTLSFP